MAPKVWTPTKVAPIITSPVKPCHAMQSEIVSELCKRGRKETNAKCDRSSEWERAGATTSTTTTTAMKKNQKEKNQSYYYLSDQSSFRLHFLSIHIIIRQLCSYSQNGLWFKMHFSFWKDRNNRKRNIFFYLMCLCACAWCDWLKTMLTVISMCLICNG